MASRNEEASERDPFLVYSTSGLRQESRPWRIHALSWAGQIGLFVLSLVLFAGSLRRGKLESSCIQTQSTYSPALEAVSDDVKTVRFNGTLDWPSPYKGPPSPEVDKKWEQITRVPLFSASLDSVRKAGLSEDSVKLPGESGDGFMAELEVFHQLHCLNLLWKGTHSEYYRNRSESWRDPPKMLRTHMDHCVDILRQKLMCDADAGIVTFNWVTGYKRPYENFNTLHKCRNFDALLTWAHRNKAPRANTPSGYPERTASSVDLERPP